MNTQTWCEEPVVFNCEGCRLVGIVTLPAAPIETGLVIVVGGPQYRAGSHRQFTLLARHLADRDIASIRFDYRGMGDSEGQRQDFNDIGPDIQAAIDTLLARSSATRRIALWGLCDAATAAAIYAHHDARIEQLIMLNPWVTHSIARMRVKTYYPQRIGQTSFWSKLFALEINILTAAKNLMRDLKNAYQTSASDDTVPRLEINTSMLYGLENFHHNTLIIIGERDLTGQSFRALVDTDPHWRKVCQGASFQMISDADHTFSNRGWRNQVAETTLHALQHAPASRQNLPAIDPTATQCDLTPLTRHRLEDIQPLWVELEGASDSSIFQSWPWTRSWISALPDSVQLYLLTIRHQDKLIGLGIFGKTVQVRHGLIRSRMLCLSETGLPEFDGLTVEHNNLLLRRGWETPAWEAALNALADWDKDWNEIRVSGMSSLATLNTLQSLARSHNLIAQVELSKPFFWVDLDALRTDQRDYLSALSSNTRQQVRKSLRLYADSGEIKLSIAQSPEQGLVYFEELRELHQRYWVVKGQPGAFASEFANRFHRLLIGSGIPSGHVQLVKLTSGEQTIGILYNLVQADKVCNYQAGLVYDDNPKRKPGLVCHVMAVEMNLARGAHSYDFLMGDSQYKRSLATRQDNMHWLFIKRPTLRFALEDLGRRTKRKLHALQNGSASQ